MISIELMSFLRAHCLLHFKGDNITELPMTCAVDAGFEALMFQNYIKVINYVMVDRGLDKLTSEEEAKKA